MRKRQVAWIGALAVGVCGLAAFAWQKEPARGASAATAFRVTTWPPDESDEDYAKAVERHLNKLAEDGWRFKSTIEGNKVRLMLFERVE